MKNYFLFFFCLLFLGAGWGGGEWGGSTKFSSFENATGHYGLGKDGSLAFHADFTQSTRDRISGQRMVVLEKDNGRPDGYGNYMDNDRATISPGGLSVYGAYTNLIEFSNDVDKGTWSATNATALGSEALGQEYNSFIATASNGRIRQSEGSMLLTEMYTLSFEARLSVAGTRGTGFQFFHSGSADGDFTNIPLITDEWQTYTVTVRGFTTGTGPISWGFRDNNSSGFVGVLLRNFQVTNSTCLYPYIETSVMVPSGPMLPLNSNMETDSDWSVLNTPTFEGQSDLKAVSGSYSWLVVTNKDNDGAFQSGISVASGNTYRLQGWVYVEPVEGATGKATLDLKDSEFGSSAKISSSTYGQWEYLSEDFTAIATSAISRINLTTTTVSGTLSFYFDDVEFFEVSAASTSAPSNRTLSTAGDYREGPGFRLVPDELSKESVWTGPTTGSNLATIPSVGANWTDNGDGSYTYDGDGSFNALRFANNLILDQTYELTFNCTSIDLSTGASGMKLNAEPTGDSEGSYERLTDLGEYRARFRNTTFDYLELGRAATGQTPKCTISNIRLYRVEQNLGSPELLNAFYGDPEGVVYRDTMQNDSTANYTTVSATISHVSGAGHRLTSTSTGFFGLSDSLTITSGDLRCTFEARGNRATAFHSVGDSGTVVQGTATNPTLSADWQQYDFRIAPSSNTFRLYLAGTGLVGDYFEVRNFKIKRFYEDAYFHPASAVGTGWSVLSDRNYACDGSQISTTNLQWGTIYPAMALGEVWEVAFEVYDWVAGGIRMFTGGAAAGTYQEGNGIYKQRVAYNGSTSAIYIQGDSSFEGKVRVIHLKRINDIPDARYRIGIVMQEPGGGTDSTNNFVFTVREFSTGPTFYRTSTTDFRASNSSNTWTRSTNFIWPSQKLLYHDISWRDSQNRTIIYGIKDRAFEDYTLIPSENSAFGSAGWDGSGVGYFITGFLPGNDEHAIIKELKVWKNPDPLWSDQ